MRRSIACSVLVPPFLWLTLAVILFACSQQSNAPSSSESLNAPNTDQPDNLGVSATEFGKFRKKIYVENNLILNDKLKYLPDKFRRNAVLIDGNRMYSNNKQLLDEMEQYTQLNGTNGTAWIDEKGQRRQMAGFTQSSTSLKDNFSTQATNIDCATDNSGPFSRVLAHPGYSWFKGIVNLPGTSEARQYPGDSIHMYTGGWSSSAAVDGGFQRNDDGRYQAILRAAFNGFSGYAISTPHHFLAGSGNLEFFTEPDNTVWLSATGYWEEEGYIDTVTLGFTSVPGFNAQGDGVQLRFTTSVAQPNGEEPYRFKDGSFVDTFWSKLWLGNYSDQNGWSGHQWMANSNDIEEVCNSPSSQTYFNDSSYWNSVFSGWQDDEVYQINIDLQ